MATWEDVDRLALELPRAEVKDKADGGRQWHVRGKALCWERALRKADLAALGLSGQPGPVIAAHVPDLGAKAALLAEDPEVYFSTPHFDGYPAVLVWLDRIGVDALEELLTEAWLDRAPKKLTADFLRDRP